MVRCNVIAFPESIITMWQLLSILAFISFVRSCSPDDATWIGHTAKIIPVQQTQGDSSSVPRIIGGSVNITSGCTFSVRNMTLIPTGDATYWWAVPNDPNQESYPRVVSAALGSYDGQSVTFNLDQRYSFKDISVMQVYSERENVIYAEWGVSGNVSAKQPDPTGVIGTDPSKWPSSSFRLGVSVIHVIYVVAFSLVFRLES